MDRSRHGLLLQQNGALSLRCRDIGEGEPARATQARIDELKRTGDLVLARNLGQTTLAFREGWS